MNVKELQTNEPLKKAKWFLYNLEKYLGYRFFIFNSYTFPIKDIYNNNFELEINEDNNQEGYIHYFDNYNLLGIVNNIYVENDTSVTSYYSYFKTYDCLSLIEQKEYIEGISNLKLNISYSYINNGFLCISQKNYPSLLILPYIKYKDDNSIEKVTLGIILLENHQYIDNFWNLFKKIENYYFVGAISFKNNNNDDEDKCLFYYDNDFFGVISSYNIDETNTYYNYFFATKLQNPLNYFFDDFHYKLTQKYVMLYSDYLGIDKENSNIIMNEKPAGIQFGYDHRVFTYYGDIKDKIYSDLRFCRGMNNIDVVLYPLQSSYYLLGDFNTNYFKIFTPSFKEKLNLIVKIVTNKVYLLHIPYLYLITPSYEGTFKFKINNSLTTISSIYQSDISNHFSLILEYENDI